MSEKNSIPLRLHNLSLELLKWWGIPVRSREGRKRDKSRGGEGREGAKICRLPSRVVRAKEERGKLSPTHKHTAAKTPPRLREEEEERGGPFFFPESETEREREMRQKRRSAFAKCSVLQGFFCLFEEIDCSLGSKKKSERYPSPFLFRLDLHEFFQLPMPLRGGKATFRMKGGSGRRHERIFFLRKRRGGGGEEEKSRVKRRINSRSLSLSPVFSLTRAYV